MKRHIPNFITCLNLASGVVAMIMAYQGEFNLALAFVLLSAAFDFCDGFAARLLKAYSPMGKELDSLADVVSFGVVPGMVAYTLLADMGLWAYLGFLITIFSALRLAKFNIDERQSDAFIGLNTPANALFWVSLAACYGDSVAENSYLLFGLIALSAFLLVSEIPMFAFKVKHLKWQGNQTRYIFLIGTLSLLLLLQLNAIPYIICWYIALAIASNLLCKKSS